MRLHFVAALFVLPLFTSACGGEKTDTRYPPREPGCDVQILSDTPPFPTHNLGAVNAFCADTVSKDDCLRELKDQTCKLGGDVVWGVSDEPAHIGDKVRYSGRAAHKKLATPPSSAAPATS